MPSLLINGVNIKYEEMGAGMPVALTPGGRAGMEGVRPLAERLASHYRVIIYDRRNCGASDVAIGGKLSEQEIWADDLYELLKRLTALPAYVGGGSAGCRVSLLVAIRHPEAVKGLLLWWVTGGAVAAERLGYTYYEQFVEMAMRGGMQEVIASEFFAERIQQNPANRQRLLAMPPQEFIDVMHHWRTFFTADKPVIGATEAELRAIHVPTAIVPGNDEIHPKAVGENLHRLLPRSELFPHPWEAGERELLMQQDPQRPGELQAERLAAVYLPFLAKVEKAGAQSLRSR
jgi:pimeloyl-ACP methyl ester carboxylesterase